MSRHHQQRPNTAQDQPSAGRRSLLTLVWQLLGLALLGQLVAAAIGYLVSNARSGKTPSRPLVTAGPISAFVPGSVTLIRDAHCYLVCLEDGGLLALSRRCTHLGCAVPWIEERQRFECPCHASAFDLRGDVLQPPATRSLDLHPLSIVDGMVRIDPSQRIRRPAFVSTQALHPRGEQ